MSFATSATSAADSGHTYTSSKIMRNVERRWDEYHDFFNQSGIDKHFREFTKRQDEKAQQADTDTDAKEQDEDDGPIPAECLPPPSIARPWPGEIKTLPYSQLVDNLYYWQCITAGYGCLRRKGEENFSEQMEEWQQYAEHMVIHLAEMRLVHMKNMLAQQQQQKGKGKEIIE